MQAATTPGERRRLLGRFVGTSDLAGARERAGLTRRGIAEELDVTPEAVRRWEAFLDLPRPEHMAELERLFRGYVRQKL